MSDWADLYNQTCDIFRILELATGYGTEDKSKVLIFGDVPCRLQPMSGDKKVEFQHLEARITHKLFLDVDTVADEYGALNLDPHDEIVIGNRIFDIRMPRFYDEDIVLAGVLGIRLEQRNV